MTCPSCGHDRHLVPYKKTRTDEHDIRRCKCDPASGGCGNEWYTREEIITIVVRDPETLREEHIPVNKFDDRYREYSLGRARHPKQLRLLD